MPSEQNSQSPQLALLKKAILEVQSGHLDQLDSLVSLLKKCWADDTRPAAEKIIAPLMVHCEKKIPVGDGDAMSIYNSLIEIIPSIAFPWEKMIVLYDEAIAVGSIEALYHCANFFHKGLGCPVNYQKAIELYEQAIAKGHVKSMNNRAYMYVHGQDSNGVNFEKAIELYDKAIALNDPSAMNNRAYMWECGQGGPIDLIKARALYAQAAALDYADALFAFGWMCEHGKGGYLDYQQATLCYEKAIKLNHQSAMQRRAILYEYGLGGPINFQQAIKLYFQVAEAKSSSLRVKAMRKVAFFYQTGKGKPIDFEQAIFWYEKAIALGDAEAMFERACMYRQGEGSPIDKKKAITLYDQSIQLGHVRALFYRGAMYLNGEEGPVDKVNAARLFRRAADKNLSAAKVALNRPGNDLFYYHHSMHKNQIETVTDLVLKEPSLLDEFFFFDCCYLLARHKKGIEQIKCFIASYLARCHYQDKQQVIYCDLLMSVKGYQEKNHYASTELIELKIDYLMKLSIGNIEEKYLIPIIELTIHTWYECSEGAEEERINAFSYEAAQLLKKCLHRLIACGKEAECVDLLINIALIVGKSRFGKNYKLDAGNWDISLEDVLLLTLEKPQGRLEKSWTDTVQMTFFKDNRASEKNVSIQNRAESDRSRLLQC